MKRKFLFIIILFCFIFFLFLFNDIRRKNSVENSQNAINAPLQDVDNTVQMNNSAAENSQNNPNPPEAGVESPVSGSDFFPPLNQAAERVTKKKFGQHVTRENSPVQPERFHGYHTGSDFEIFPSELNEDMQVKAICAGKLLTARTASGYGGVAVQSCELNDESITVVYGHLNIASLKFKVGDRLKAGDILGSLGTNKSAQTDGERKHLHLAIHKSGNINILGYVQNKSELAAWVDPCEYVCE